MVSKIVLACLATLATISMSSGTTLPSQGPNFGYCVSGIAYINKKFSLGFVIQELLGGVLNLVGNIVEGLLDFVGGLLGLILGGKKIPYVSAPGNIQNFAGVCINVGPVFGKLVAPVFGASFDINIFADVHGALSLSLFKKLQLDIAGAAYLKNAISLNLAQQKVVQIAAILNSNKFKSGQWAQAAALINAYIIVVNQEDINVDLYVAATIKYVRVQVALLKMSGFSFVNEYAISMAQSCNSVFSQIGYFGSVSASDFIVAGIPSNCNCFEY